MLDVGHEHDTRVGGSAAALDPDPRVPGHVALVVDGPDRGADPSGARHLHDVLRWCASAGIEVLTLWVRPGAAATGVAAPAAIADVVRDLTESGTWQVRHIGRASSLPGPLAAELERAADATVAPGTPVLNLALAYSGRHDVADAVRALAEDSRARGGTLQQFLDELSVDAVSARISTAGLADPDLIVTTAGRSDLAGFLLWQAAHSELYVSGVSWSDLDEAELSRALEAYAARDRRFGR